MANKETQRKFAARRRAEGLTKYCEWIPLDRLELMRQVVQFYSECDLTELADAVARIG